MGKQKEGPVEVTLVCKVPIHRGIEKWKNVTYKIDIFADGKLVKSKERCGGLPPGKVNQDPCPNGDLESTLSGDLYKISQWVS